MLAVFDFDRLYMHIPNLYTGAILWLGILASIHGISAVPFDVSIYGVFLAYGVLYVLRGLFLYFRDVEALGSGDAPLAAAFAAWLGVYQVPYFLLMASIFGIFWIYVHSRILSRSVIGFAIPFGPSLVIACLVLFLVGNPNEISPLP
jgi:prepilin signal peptidase PulO-like enzyme (type II secretory pathway)